jgi:hypothetical protein
LVVPLRSFHRRHTRGAKHQGKHTNPPASPQIGFHANENSDTLIICNGQTWFERRCAVGAVSKSVAFAPVSHSHPNTRLTTFRANEQSELGHPSSGGLGKPILPRLPPPPFEATGNPGSAPASGAADDAHVVGISSCEIARHRQFLCRNICREDGCAPLSWMLGVGCSLFDVFPLRRFASLFYPLLAFYGRPNQNHSI